MGFPQTTALYELLQYGSTPQGPSFRNRLLQHGSSMSGSSHQTSSSTVGSSPWAVVLVQTLLLQGFSIGCSPLQDTSTCPTGSFSMGGSMEICSSTVHHRLHGDSLLHCEPLRRPQRNFSSGTWSTSCSPSALTLVSKELFFSHSPTPISLLLWDSFCCCCCFCFRILNIYSQRSKQCCSLVQLCPVTGCFCSQLELALM